jgi:hypothetical protein
MKLGFTGNQIGLNPMQQREFIDLLLELQPVEFHHGDCIGSDKQAHDMVRWHAPRCKIVIHPPSIRGRQAFCLGDHHLDPAPYLVRNHAIVDATDRLAATPKTRREELRSGTWATVRYARKTGKTIHMLYPWEPGHGQR